MGIFQEVWILPSAGVYLYYWTKSADEKGIKKMYQNNHFDKIDRDRELDMSNLKVHRSAET